MEDNIKKGKYTPVFKKDDFFDKLNYRPVRIFPLLSQLYEELICNKQYELAENILNSILCCFREAHSTQHALFKLLQSRQEEIDNHGFLGKYNLNGFIEGLYCISQELLISKLDLFGVTQNSLKLILSDLSRHKQRIKIGSSVTPWYDVITGVLQGFILGPLHFIKRSHVCYFADDNSFYSCNKNLSEIFQDLVCDLTKVSN